jgi:hypothetical protein
LIGGATLLWVASAGPALSAPADQAATPTVVAVVAVSQAQATPTVRVAVVTTTQSQTTAPHAGELPVEFALPLFVGGAVLLAGGVLVWRGRPG